MHTAAILLLQMQVPTDTSHPDVTGNSFMLFATVLFTVGVLFYIFKPPRAEQGEEKTRLGYLYERKDQTSENLRVMNFEYKAGKLSDADFTSLRDSLEQDAANLLAEIEELEKQSITRQEIRA
jgi:predicted membrane channel-forming protein YqfA (hemolysin III family)